MNSFLQSERPDRPAAQCRFQVLCAPIEKTVSYGGGTARGPQAILAASDQLEAFDGQSCPCELGIHTHPHPLQTLEAIEVAVSAALGASQIPILLGGEHTVSLGALRALRARGESFGIIQFDAHADLRDEYEGSRWSHACVMRRAVDELDLPLFQIGVRALCVEEHAFRRERGIGHSTGWNFLASDFPTDFPKKVYITFDVDGLDPSAMPSTGTPVPNGLSWREAFGCLDQIATRHQILAADVVELAPIAGLHAPDFGAAQLVYHLMGLIARG